MRLLLFAASLVVAFVGETFLITFRAQTFGLSYPMLVVILALAGVVTTFLWLALGRSAPRRRYLLCLVAFTLFFVPEVWFGADDACFQREVGQSGKPTYSRSRWCPFASYGLIYTDGTTQAHD